MLHSRLARVAELVKEELGEIIDQKLVNPSIPPFTTIHSVKVAKDLRVADVYVTFLQDDNPVVVKKAVEELNHAAGFIRGELGHRIKLRYLPTLRFHYNPSTHYAAHLEELFRGIQLEKETSSEVSEQEQE